MNTGNNYIKNNRIYFVYQKLTATEHIIWTDNSKILGIYETRYYFDSNGKIVRYVDEKGNPIKDPKQDTPPSPYDTPYDTCLLYTSPSPRD